MCVLRVYGDENFDPKKFLENTSLKPYQIFVKGEPIPGRKNKISEYSGFQADVSDKEWADLPGQIKDAIKFLKNHEEILDKLSNMTAIEKTLDFPLDVRVNRNKVLGQFDYFPPELLKICGELNIGIEISHYF